MEKNKLRQTLKTCKQDPFLNSKYDLLNVLGEGCFGKILKVLEKDTEEMLALKIEKKSKKNYKMVLHNQIKILKILQGRKGIPRIFSAGEWQNGTYLQLQLLAHDLSDARKYSITEITSLTLDLLSILKEIHDCNVIHQDLKPQNMMRSSQGQLFIIDYGLARYNPRKGYSIKGFIGTPRYASLRAHNMFQQSKKDDLESLFYNIAYLYYQKLPWSKLNVSSDKRLEKIKLLKEQHQNTLFQEMTLPFQEAFTYIRSLKPFQEPNYRLLEGFFKRNKAVVLQPQLPTERSKVKKVSVNKSNFLQIPANPLKINSKGARDERSSASSQNSCVSNSTGAGFSTQVHNSIQIHDNMIAEQNTQKKSTNEWQDLQCDCQEDNLESQTPKIAEFARNLVLKNPFS